MKKQMITLTEEKLNEYILNHFQENALLEISYNRVFLPGKIINIHNEEELILTIQLKGELLNQTVDINIDEIKQELVELQYTYEDMCKVITII